MVDLQGKTKRELTNRLSDLHVKIASIESDLKKIERRKSEHELLIRRLKKAIQRQELELDKTMLVAKQFEKDEFQLNNKKRFLKKQVQEAMAAKRMESSKY